MAGCDGQSPTCRLFVVLVRLTQHQLVLAAPEGVAEHGDWVQIHVRVGALCLARAGAVEVPDRQVCKRERVHAITTSRSRKDKDANLHQLSLVKNVASHTKYLFPGHVYDDRTLSVINRCILLTNLHHAIIVNKFDLWSWMKL